LINGCNYQSYADVGIAIAFSFADVGVTITFSLALAVQTELSPLLFRMPCAWAPFANVAATALLM
jgi:hypothetical protein